jgi:hypothetical protein
MILHSGWKRAALAGVVLGTASVGMVASRALADDAPKRVTGVSFALETMRTGNQIGAAEGYALVLSAVGAAAPAPGTVAPADPVLQPVVQQGIVALGGQHDIVNKLTAANDSGLAQAQNAVQPLAALNAPANQAIDAAANAMNQAADALGPQIQPADKTVKETAKLVREVEAPPGG